MPSENSPTRRSAAPVRSTRASSSSMRRSPTPAGIAATRRLSRAVRPAWKLLASSSAPTVACGRGRSAYRRPPIVAVPAVGATSPSSVRRVVVLPAPFGPRKPVTRPGRTVKDRSDTAVTCPNRFVRPRTSTTRSGEVSTPESLATMPDAAEGRGSGRWRAPRPPCDPCRSAPSLPFPPVPFPLEVVPCDSCAPSPPRPATSPTPTCSSCPPTRPSRRGSTSTSPRRTAPARRPARRREHDRRHRPADGRDHGPPRRPRRPAAGRPPGRRRRRGRPRQGLAPGARDAADAGPRGHRRSTRCTCCRSARTARSSWSTREHRPVGVVAEVRLPRRRPLHAAAARHVARRAHPRRRRRRVARGPARAPSTTLHAARRRFAPVVREGRLVGVLTRTGALRSTIYAPGARRRPAGCGSPSPSASTATSRRRPRGVLDGGRRRARRRHRARPPGADARGAAGRPQARPRRCRSSPATS